MLNARIAREDKAHAKLEGRIRLSLRRELRQGVGNKVMSSRQMPKFPFCRMTDV